MLAGLDPQTPVGAMFLRFARTPGGLPEGVITQNGQEQRVSMRWLRTYRNITLAPTLEAIDKVEGRTPTKEVRAAELRKGKTQKAIQDKSNAKAQKQAAAIQNQSFVSLMGKEANALAKDTVGEGTFLGKVGKYAAYLVGGVVVLVVAAVALTRRR